MRRPFFNNRSLVVGSVSVLLLLLGLVGSGVAAMPFAPNFGTDGVSETQLPAEDRQLIAELGQGPLISDLAVTPSGGLVAAVGSGTENEFFGAASFRARGALDERFGSAGFVRASIFPSLVRNTEPQAEGVAVQRDGKIVLVGYRKGVASGTPAPVVMRLLPNGSPDRSFAQRGLFAPKPDGARADSLRAVAIQPGGRIVAVGVRSERDRTAVQVKRPAGFVVAYRPDGSVDPGFGRAGRVFFYGPKARYAFTGLLDLSVLANGKILVVGYRDNRLLVARLGVDGGLDRSFGGGDGTVSVGLVRQGVCCPEDASLFSLSGGGSVVLTDGFSPVLMVRLRPNGGFDKRFGRQGILRSNSQSRPWMRDLAVQGDGRIVAVGRGEGGFTVMRFRPNGQRDRSFGRRGVATLPRGHTAAATSAATLPSGRVVVGGGAQYRRNDRLEYSLLLALLR